MGENISNSFMNNTGLNITNSFTHLIQHISTDLENETDLIEHSKYYSETKFIEMYNETSSEISILNLNCGSLNAKYDKLKIFLNIVDPHSQITCITLQETWCNDSTDLSQFIIPGYTMISKPKQANVSEHGGLIIYVNDDYNFVEMPGNNSLIHETLGVEIWRKTANNKNKFTIFSVYRVPTGIIEDLLLFINKFTELLENYHDRKVYVCCDTNIDLLQINCKPHYNMFYENITQAGYLPKITLPTRLGGNTLIDNIFTNNMEKSHVSGIFQGKISDHQMTFCMVKGTACKKNTAKFVEVETVNQHTLTNLKMELNKENIYEKLNTNLMLDPNINCQILLSSIIDAKNKHMPNRLKKFNKRKHKKEKWMTDSLLTLVNRKNALYVDWKTKSPTIAIYESKKKHFRAFDRIVNQQKNEAKRIYYHTVFNTHKNNLKNTWKIINESLNRKKGKNDLPTEFYHQGETLTDPNQIANSFNEYFRNIGFELASNINIDDTDATPMQYLCDPTQLRCNFNLVNSDDILQIINKMENKISSGIDGISNKILKYIKEEIAKPIALIINQMFTTGTFPDTLKVSKIIPLHKKGNAALLSNYRPISLLPTISKIFERVICNQLYTYFNDNELISEQQYGFRTRHSTELAAVKLVDYITKSMDNSKTPINIYIDLSKAFDTIDFNILLKKLEYYGVKGISLKLFQSYLTNRKQYVKFGTHESKHIITATGVPQGSILGPLLFSIYINDLVLASEKFNYIMYADDTTLYFNLEDFNQNCLAAEITNELDKINTWLKINKLSINVDKTKFMMFRTKQKRVDPIIIHFNNIVIEKVCFFNYLGIYLDENITWHNHTTMVQNKLSKIIGILNRLKNIYPEQVLLTIYNSLFLSHIHYGILLWGTRLNCINTLQKKAVRIITNSNYIAHSEPLLKELKLLKVEDIFHLKLLKFYYNLSYNFLPTYFYSYQEFLNGGHMPQALPYDLRANARPLVRPPRILHKFSESSVLYQLVKVINHTHVKYPDILMKVHEKSHSYYGFSYNVKSIYLAEYSLECNLIMCYKCGR